MKEGAWIAKLGSEALKQINNSNFLLINEVDPIGPMFASVWGAMYAVFSTLIEIFNDNEMIELCIEGLMNSIRICGHFNMITEWDAFVSSLSKFTGLHAWKEIQIKNIYCTKALLQLGLEDGNCLKESWYYVLECVSRLNYFLTKAAGLK